MFDLDPGKLILIGIVALIAIPSKDLPRVLRQLGQMSGRMRRMASEFQGQFMDAMRESELDEIKKEFKNVKDSVKMDGSFDPMSEVRKQINHAVEGSAAKSADAESGVNQPHHPEQPKISVSKEAEDEAAAAHLAFESGAASPPQTDGTVGVREAERKPHAGPGA
jgi:sec-independent protein translocase protein TatB